MLLVVLLKHVFLLEVSEQHHDLIQHTLNVIVCHSLQALAQLVVHEQANELWAALTQVDEGLKAMVQDILKGLVIVERGGDDPALKKDLRKGVKQLTKTTGAPCRHGSMHRH